MQFKTYTEELRKVLSYDLYDNICKAYQIRLQAGDAQSEKACRIADDYFYKNANAIIEILQQYAGT